MTVALDPLLVILRAQTAYARCLDDGDLEDWPAFFEDACLYRITSAENHRQGLEAGLIYADSRAMLTDRVSALREANFYERHNYRHILGVPFVVEDGGGTVRSETPFMVARIMRDGTTDLFATGRYLDLWRIEGGDARLIEKLVVCDSGRIDTLLALPL